MYYYYYIDVLLLLPQAKLNMESLNVIHLSTINKIHEVLFGTHGWDDGLYMVHKDCQSILTEHLSLIKTTPAAILHVQKHLLVIHNAYSLISDKGLIKNTNKDNFKTSSMLFKQSICIDVSV